MHVKPLNAILLVAVVAGSVGVAAIILLRHGPTPPAPSAPATPPVAAAAAAPVSCLLPGPAPVPPNGETASADDMKLGHDVMQHFVDQLEAYQACRDSQADHAAPGVSAQQKQTWIEQGDAAIDQANDLAAAFSVQLKAFKARPKK